MRLARVVLAALAFLIACASPAFAQNTTCPNVPFGDSSQRCANTKFVQDAIAGTPATLIVGATIISGGTPYGVLFNNNGLLGNTAAGTAGYALIGNGAAAPTFQPFLAFGVGASNLTWQNKARQTISVRDYGAICDGAHPVQDTAAFLAAIARLQTNSVFRGGVITIPAAPDGTPTYCNITSTLAFTAFSQVHNIWLKGEGPINTVLDFSGATAGTDAITFNAGAHCGVQNLEIFGAQRDGISIQGGALLCQFENLRIQGSVRHGYNGVGPFLTKLSQIWSRDNGGNGFIIASGTSISGDNLIASTNALEGFTIDNLAYSNFSAVGSDANRYGYSISNVAGVTFNGMGSESNLRDGCLITASNAQASGKSYPDIKGLTINGFLGYNNSTGGAFTNGCTVSSSDSRTINVTFLSPSDLAPTVGTSFLATGTGVTIVESLPAWAAASTYSSGAVRVNLSSTPLFPSLGLSGLTSGTLTLKAPSVAGSNTLTFPAGTTDFSATGGTSQVVKQTSLGGAFTVARLACSDLSNATSACSTAPAALTKTDDTNVTLTLGGTPATALLQATSLTLGWTGTLSPARGGTGTANGTSNTIAFTGNFSLGITLTNTTAVTFPTSGTLATTAGPNLPSVATGDLLYGSSANVLSALADVATGNALISGGVSTAPLWGKITSSHLNITTTACTNQFLTAISATGTGTCTTDTLASAQHANQGTTTTVLHGNAAGNPTWAAVSLTADISGVLPIANGGTNAASQSTNGIAFFNGSAVTSDGTILGFSGNRLLALTAGAGAGQGPGMFFADTTPQNIGIFGKEAVVLGTGTASNFWVSSYVGDLVFATNSTESFRIIRSTNLVTFLGTTTSNAAFVASTYLSAGTKLRAVGTAPALTSCGTSPAIEGSDLSGTVTMGTGSPTGCVITFNVAYANAPRCTVSWRSNLGTMQYTTSTTAITLTQTATSSNLVDYICTARTGGWLFNRDLDPAANDNTPAFMNKAA
jgi:hypothetical protein